MKKCPYCAEEIQDDAVKCRYCQSSVEQVAQNNEQVGATSNYGKNLSEKEKAYLQKLHGNAAPQLSVSSTMSQATAQQPQQVIVKEKKKTSGCAIVVAIILVPLLLIIIISALSADKAMDKHEKQPPIQQNVDTSKEKVLEVKDDKQVDISDVESKKLDVSYTQMMNYLSNFFVMEKATQVDGEDRYMGSTTSGLANLEIIGDKKNITQATLMIGIPSDRPDAIIENSAIALRFLENVMPEADGASDWVMGTFEDTDKLFAENAKKTYGEKEIEIIAIKELGIVTIVVSHK